MDALASRRQGTTAMTIASSSGSASEDRPLAAEDRRRAATIIAGCAELVPADAAPPRAPIRPADCGFEPVARPVTHLGGVRGMRRPRRVIQLAPVATGLRPGDLTGRPDGR
jgi:hypothetical protein